MPVPTRRRLIAALLAVLILLPVLIWSRAEKPAEQPMKTGLPKALGAVQPRLSPDGDTIAFSYQGEIWTVPRAGGTMTLLTPSQGLDTEPAWSPDGRRVAFVRGGAVKIVDSPGGKDVPLPKTAAVGGTYAVNKLEFSPDGKRLLGAFRVGAANRLAWFDLESGELTPLVPASSYFRFALSPDGKRIVHTSIPDEPGEQSGNNGSYTDLWELSADGTGKVAKLCRIPARVHDLCWADGGSLIVAMELGQAHDDLWRVPLADPLRGMVKLTSGQADEDRPSVSRNGKWLVYTDNRSGPTALVVREMAGGEESAVRFDAMDYRRPTGTLKITIKDSASEKPTVARISLKEDGGRSHAPAGSLYRSLRGRGHFYCDKAAVLTIPAGTYHLSGYRGPEYKLARQDIVIKDGQAQEVTVAMDRWVHMAKDGWYSGELHIHANYGYGSWFNTPETMRRQCVGEDLNVCNFMVANSDADVVYDRPFFRGGPDPLSTDENILYWNQEFRSTLWGQRTTSTTHPHPPAAAGRRLTLSLGRYRGKIALGRRASYPVGFGPAVAEVLQRGGGPDLCPEPGARHHVIRAHPRRATGHVLRGARRGAPGDASPSRGRAHHARGPSPSSRADPE
jgi:hypothetical protein